MHPVSDCNASSAQQMREQTFRTVKPVSGNDVHKSGDNRPSVDEVDAAVAYRNARPKVLAVDVAERLGLSPSQLSKWENSRPGAPDLSVADYREAVAAEKRQGAAA